MRRIISAIIAAAMIISSLPILAAAETVSNTVSGYVSCTDGDIEIASREKIPNIYVDAENDYAGVTRVAGDLQSDIAAVTGVTANIVNDATDADIIIGTIGMSEAVDSLIAEGRLDVSEIEGEWEAFTLRNVDGDLVIAGADKHGTIYGVYDLSEKMGVSPWEWWADVTPSHSDAIYVTLPEDGYTEGAPSVKYRGIFINQEYNLNQWSLSLDSSGPMNTATYEKIFELLLRLKANYMWPAMHEYSPAFNSNPANAAAADEYGIVMGSSHCEMLLRNNMGELLEFQQRWIEEHPDADLYMYHDGSLDADVAYDYTDVDEEGNPVDNKQFVEDYWRERVRANGSYENVYTIGMRGVHDGTWDPVNADTDAEKIALLEEIIDKQREILSQETGKPAEEIPQVFIPYKEIADLYNKGIDIPDDVTIMFTNDNYGYVRQGMTEEENARSGGGGIYYHVSYHGRPSDLLWNGSTQLGLIKEEMTKAYDSGADTIWLLNVGPLKPFENQMEYFLDLGRNIDELRDVSIMDYVADNAKRYFGFDEEQAREYAAIQCERLELVNGRRPEFYEQGLFSLTSYGDEGQKIIDAYAGLFERSEILYDSLPAEKKAGYYELQHYAVKSAYHIAMNYINADRSVLYKEQGRGAGVNKYAELSEVHGKSAIEADIAEYETIENGKWTGMIDPFVTKNGLNASWNFSIASAEAETVTELTYTEMGVAVENQQDINTRPALEFSGYTKDVRFIDIFNKGTGSFDWKASADADWIIFNKESGTVYDDDRIYAGIDWDSAPEGESTAVITITRYIGETAVVSEQIEVKLNNNVEELPEKTYAEANGYVSIEAEHYTESVSKSSGESSLTDGVVTGSTPRLITDVSGGIGIIAVYAQDGTLSSVQLSETYSNGAYAFETPVEPAADETVKGMVWSSFEEMKPLADAYGLAEEKATVVYEWQEQDDFGRSGTSMKFMPNAAESISDNSAYLEYNVNFESTGTFDVDVYRMPTLNERGSVKFAVGIDGEQPSELTGNNDYYASSSSPHTGDWAEGILNNNETLTTTVTVDEPGIHAIKLYGIDPGGAVDKIVITTGTKYDSYYGAPESYNTTYNNAAAEMPEPSEPSTEITGDVTALFAPQLYTAGINLSDGAVTGVDILKLTDIESAQVTVAAYGSDRAMLSNATVAGDFSRAGINEKVTVPVSFSIPQGAAELQVIVYDNTAALNALAPAYTTDVDSVSLAAAYDSGVIEVRSSLDQYTGKEALCLISNDETGEAAYIRQETVGDNTFRTIRTGELDGTYSINIGVAGEGVVIAEKAYTAEIITPDNKEKSETLYSWDFSDASQTASEGSNIPVLGGDAAYDSAKQAVRMPATERTTGSLNVTLDEPVKTVQGEEITVVSKIAYGREGGSFMDYNITDSNGKELFGSHICVYNSDGTQSLRIGGEELLGSGLPAGIVTSNKNNDGYQNGYSTFTVTLSPDTNTITLTVLNDEGESTYTGSFPEGTSYDVNELSYAISRTYTSRSCYVDDISITKTKAPSYTMSFDVKDTASNAIENAAITVTDGIYGEVIEPESDGTYDLCDGIYSYTVTADGYDTVTGELELTPATGSKTISVTMEGTGTAVSPSPSASPEPSPSTSPEPSPSAPPASDYDNTAGYWKFDFGADAVDGYIGVSADKSFSDDLTYGFIGIKEEDYKLSSGEYMDGFRMLEGQKITLANGSGTAAEAPDNDFVAVTDPQYPIRFTMSVENGGYYNVKVTLANASQTEPAYVTLMTERRHQLLTNAEIPAGETLEYEFNVDVETYYWKALNGRYNDDTLSIEVAGENAAVSSVEVTKADKNGTTLWMITDSTGCDQPTNFPYVNINSLAGVGQGMTKYLPVDVALSNQGDGGLASNDTNHYNCAKAGFKEGDYLYIEYGHNETSVDRYVENLQKYYDDCHAAGVKMIVVGPIDRCQTSQFSSSAGTWSPSGLPNYSAAGKAFVEEKIADGAEDIAFVDLNAPWIEFLNETTQRVSEIRGNGTYEPDSVYYYYRYKASGIDTTHINEAGADVAAYIFFEEAKKIVEAGGVQADVLAGLVNGMRDNTPYIVPDEIIAARPVPNSYYPESPMQVYEGYEAFIRGAAFSGNELKSVTANVEYYTGLEKKNIPYAVAVAEMYDSEGGLAERYQSTTGTKYDTTNGSGTFAFEFEEGAVMPEGGSYRIYLQGFTNDNVLMEGDKYRISDYFTPESASNMSMIGDLDDIELPDTFDYYGVRVGADLAGNNGWYMVGSSTRSATLENDGGRSYAQLTKSSSSGSYVVYRAFDSAVTGGRIILETDLYYESGRVDFIFSNKTNVPNNGYAQRITAFKVNNGTLYDSADNELGEVPENEWVKVRYVLDMDYGMQTLTVGDNEYSYTAAGMDSINPDNITVSALQQLNIAGSGSSTLSARITNTSVKTETNDEMPDMTLTLIEPDSIQGTASIADSSGLTKTAAMNSIVSVSAIPNDGYIFVGWFDENNEFVSGNDQAQIRLHRDVTLTAVFEADDDPIEYVYRETFTALSTSTLAENDWVSDSAQSYLTVRNDNDEGTDGNYLYFNPNRGSRNMSGAFTLAERIDERYIIEMDFGISNGSGGDTAESEFTLMTSGTISATNRMVSGEYLLKLNATEKSSGSSENSMTWSINDGVESTVTLEQSGNNPVWAHLKLTVDPETGTAQLVITQNGEEKYNGIITMGVKNGDYSVTGLHFYAGRQYSKCQFDNIRVYTASQLETLPEAN